MDKQLKASDENLNPNLVITITMKKLENHANSGAGSSLTHANDSNNNDGVPKSVKKESAAKEFCKSLFNKSTSSGDKNNNPAPVSNQYTKMTVDGLMSQLTLHQNRQMNQLAQQGNAISVTQSDVSKRYNPAHGEQSDADECARIQRALEIQQGIEVPLRAEGYTSSSSSSPLMVSRPDANQQARQESCMKCQQNQNQLEHLKQIGQSSIISLADGEPPKYHSQDYYYHFLVPDLEKITACCYYWGKMDRYEAERLLDGKPEGTFLLRDSAQDDYLFSVSFRKYGRSLHARIEQWNHKFSFDSHDPSVYTASTVTGLVEHYKDPSSVMFFEPMLTSPLHRNYVFSLEQLCRAAIVSHTTYDGINDLCLPATMKSYLKEYHYKLKIRVRQFPEGAPNLSSS